MELIHLVIACMVFIGSGIAAVIRVSFAIKDALSTVKSEFHAMLELEQERRAKDIARTYERFDEYKCFSDINFVRKDICGVMHNGTAQAITDMKISISDLSKKVDELKTMMVGRNDKA